MMVAPGFYQLTRAPNIPGPFPLHWPSKPLSCGLFCSLTHPSDTNSPPGPEGNGTLPPLTSFELPVKQISFSLGPPSPPEQRLERRHESFLSCPSFLLIHYDKCKWHLKNAICLQPVPCSLHRWDPDLIIGCQIFHPKEPLTKLGCFSLQVSINQLSRLLYKYIKCYTSTLMLPF